MRAISLWQPWASLVAAGLKVYETRHWSTDYRGALAIHAAKRRVSIVGWEQTAADWAARLSVKSLADLPYGAFVGINDLTDVVRTEDLADLTELERSFGDFRPGRFAWRTANPRQLQPPIAERGYQGLWPVGRDMASQLEARANG